MCAMVCFAKAHKFEQGHPRISKKLEAFRSMLVDAFQDDSLQLGFKFQKKKFHDNLDLLGTLSCCSNPPVKGIQMPRCQI